MKRFHLIYLLILSSLIVACKDSNSVNIISVPSDNSIAESESIKYTLAVEELINDISEGLPAEIELRRKQYDYYRNKLLSFGELSCE